MSKKKNTDVLYLPLAVSKDWLITAAREQGRHLRDEDMVDIEMGIRSGLDDFLHEWAGDNLYMYGTAIEDTGTDTLPPTQE